MSRCHDLGVLMSDDWPRGWYADEPDQPRAAGPRPQPSFTPGQQGQRSYGGGPAGPSGPAAGRTAWPGQPPSRSWPGAPGRRRWLRPRRILVILAGLVVLIVLAGGAVYFSVSSKLTKVDVLVPTALT